MPEGRGRGAQSSTRGRAGAWAAGIAVLVTLAVAAARPAFAAGAGEAIDSYNVAIQIKPDGSLQVEEVITYQFGVDAKHGILRHIPVRQRFDDHNDRVWRISDVKVAASPPGTPADLKVSDGGHNKMIRIGDPKHTVTGPHTYTIDYRVEGAIVAFVDHDELYWNAIGTEWPVPVAHPSVVVTAPSPVTRVACFAGRVRSTNTCGSSQGVGMTTVNFTNRDLKPAEGITVVVALPRGAVPATGPILDQRWALSRAFAVTPVTGSAAGILTLIGLALAAYVLHQHRRERRLVRGTVDPLVGQHRTREDEIGRLQAPLPEGMRPGLAGVLIELRATSRHVTATIVDLAIRGYLVIEETGRYRKDWRLTSERGADAQVLSYERELLDVLFQGGRTSLTVADLSPGDLHRVEDKLCAASVDGGYFHTRPDQFGAHSLVVAVTVVVVGVAAVIALAATTHAALAVVPIPFVGLLLLGTRHWMTARTAKGRGALGEVLRLRSDLTENEYHQTRPDDDSASATHLPYAIVFRLTRRWAKRFDASTTIDAPWYQSPDSLQPDLFAARMDDFTSTAAPAIDSNTSNSRTGWDWARGSSGDSSGFSGDTGGGGGGGGGDSW